MANQLNIQIGAEVNGALRGLQQVEQQSQRTFQKVSQSSIQAGSAVNNLSRIVQDAPFGFIGISNNLQPLFDDFTRLKSQTGSVGGALKSLAGSLTGPAGIGLAFAAATSLLTIFSKELFGSGKAAQDTKGKTDALKDSINGIFSQTAKEASNVTALTSVLKSETETRERKLQAIKELQQIQPDIFNGLRLEGNAVIGLDNAYKNYIDNLKNVIAAKVKQAQLEQVLEKLLKAQGVTLTSQEKALVEFGNAISQYQINLTKGTAVGAQIAKKQSDLRKEELNNIKALEKEVQRLAKDLTELSGGIKIDIPTAKVNKVELPEDNKLTFTELDIQFKTLNTNKELEKTLQNLVDKYSVKIDPTKGISKTFDELKKQIVSLEKTSKDAFEDQLKTAVSVANAVSNTFSKAFSSILEGQNVFAALGEALKGFVLELVQATIKALIFRAIVNAIVPGGAQAIGATGIANLLGFRANGGPVTGRSPYIVGERGPELFVPSVSGNIVPNNQLSSFNGRPAFAAAMGGGRSIVRGTDILLASARTQRSIARVNG